MVVKNQAAPQKKQGEPVLMTSTYYGPGILLGSLSSLRRSRPEFEDAALCVETLFGRKLANDPLVISLVQVRSKISGARFDHTNNQFYFPEQHTTNPKTHTLIHEFVHSEMRWCPPRMDEAFAVFAENYYLGQVRKTGQKEKIEVPSNCNGIPCDFDVETLRPGRLPMSNTPFYSALNSLAKKVGDPIKAFQISTQKRPQNFWQFLKATFTPSKFYGEEIAKAKEEQSGVQSV